jgi:phage shock protein C
MPSYCAGCGASLPGGARFCPACGKAVSLGRLTRPLVGKKLAGVCQGLAMRYGWDVTLIRVIAVLLAVAAFPFGVIAYLLLWVFIPQELPMLPASPHLDIA